MNVPAFVRPATAVGKDPFYFTRGGCDIRELLSAKVTGELLSCIISICAMNNAKSLRIDPLVIAIRAQLGHMRSSGEAPVSAIDLALGELDATGELPAFPIQEPLPACRHLVEIDNFARDMSRRPEWHVDKPGGSRIRLSLPIRERGPVPPANGK